MPRIPKMLQVLDIYESNKESQNWNVTLRLTKRLNRSFMKLKMNEQDVQTTDTATHLKSIKNRKQHCQCCQVIHLPSLLFKSLRSVCVFFSLNTWIQEGKYVSKVLQKINHVLLNSPKQKRIIFSALHHMNKLRFILYLNYIIKLL